MRKGSTEIRMYGAVNYSSVQGKDERKVRPTRDCRRKSRRPGVSPSQSFCKEYFASHTESDACSHGGSSCVAAHRRRPSVALIKCPLRRNARTKLTSPLNALIYGNINFKLRELSDDVLKEAAEDILS